MVQLKVCCNGVNRHALNISIPYGSIKSVHAFGLNAPQTHISIPYGSIKRQLCMANGLFFTVFQFLMVQLKDPPASTMSIISLFQFLMVQLKVLPEIQTHLSTQISIPYGSIKRKILEISNAL